MSESNEASARTAHLLETSTPVSPPGSGRGSPTSGVTAT